MAAHTSYLRMRIYSASFPMIISYSRLSISSGSGSATSSFCFALPLPLPFDVALDFFLSARGISAEVIELSDSSLGLGTGLDLGLTLGLALTTGR